MAEAPRTPRQRAARLAWAQRVALPVACVVGLVVLVLVGGLSVAGPWRPTAAPATGTPAATPATLATPPGDESQAGPRGGEQPSDAVSTALAAPTADPAA